MNDEIVLGGIKDIVELPARAAKILDTSPEHLWWRGQADVSWKLQASALRLHSSSLTERNMYNHFLRKAGSRRDSVPAFEDCRSWLLLMQHYDLPTRLLDWTESALIGTYFAVSNEKLWDVDGSLFAMVPYILNHLEYGHRSVPTPMSPGIDKFFRAPFDQELAFELASSGKERAVAFYPHEFDPRMLAQQTVMTIHSSHTPMEEMGLVQKFLVKCTIPAAAKRELHQALDGLGVRRSSLFPDLTNLAKDARRPIMWRIDFSTT